MPRGSVVLPGSCAGHGCLGLYTNRVRSSTGSSGSPRGLDRSRRRARRPGRPRWPRGASSVSSPACAHPGGQRVDRVALLPLLDLGLVPVPVRVVHRVGAEPVGAQLQEVRAAAAADRLRGVPGGLLDREHVHPVHRPGGHAVAGGPHRQVGLRLRPVERRAHGVQVVLAAEQHRQLPQRGQVQALVELALGDRAVAEEAGRDPGLAAHLVGERDTDRQRQPAADDRVPAVEPASSRRTGASTRRGRGCTRWSCRTSRPSPPSAGCRARGRGRARGRWTRWRRRA